MKVNTLNSFHHHVCVITLRSRSVDSPTICMSIMAVSTWFSTCTLISYFPEWLRSALRIKMMLSQSVLRMLTWEGSMELPSFIQVTFGRGLPCKQTHEATQSLYCTPKMCIITGNGRFTMKGTTRLTASPTLRTYVCFRCRGTRIFGCSAESHHVDCQV